MSQQVQVGVVGCGSIVAMMHLPILKNVEGVNIKFLADLHLPQELAADFGSCAIRLEKEAASLPSCDIACLAMPVGRREPYIEEFGKRDTLIFTEKPFAVDEVSHKRLLGLAKALSCNYVRTFFSSTRQISELIASKPFGELRSVFINEGGIVGATGKPRTHYQNDIAQSGGGILLETGCHTLSQIAHALGQFTYSIETAKVQRNRGLDVDISTWFKVVRDNEIDVHLELSRIRPLTNVARFMFDTAEVSFDHTNPASPLLVQDRQHSYQFHIQADDVWAQTLEQAFFLKWMDVIQGSKGRKEFDSSYETSLMTTSLTDAIYAAS